MEVNNHPKAVGARCCSVHVAQFLVEHGAEVYMTKGAGGHSPLFAATKHSDQDAAKFIRFMLDSFDTREIPPNRYFDPAGGKIDPALVGVTWEMLVEEYGTKSPEPQTSSQQPFDGPGQMPAEDADMASGSSKSDSG